MRLEFALNVNYHSASRILRVTLKNAVKEEEQVSRFLVASFMEFSLPCNPVHHHEYNEY